MHLMLVHGGPFIEISRIEHRPQRIRKIDTLLKAKFFKTKAFLQKSDGTEFHHLSTVPNHSASQPLRCSVNGESSYPAQVSPTAP